MSQIRENEYVINDDNWKQFVDQAWIAGEKKAFGLIPRDFSVQPYGGDTGLKAVDMPVIPRSEWSARIKEKIETKSQLSDIRMMGNAGQFIPSLDQNGQGYCATEDTEVLTNKGFVPWPEYNGKDDLGTVNTVTGMLEFQTPLERQVFNYKGEMIYSTNRRIDFGVTPNHRMLVRKWDEQKRTLSDAYDFVTAENLGWYVGLPHAPKGWLGTEIKRLEVPGDREYEGDDFFALLGLIVSDGFAGGTENTENLVSFCSFRDEKKEEIAALASRYGFREKPSRPGVWNIYSASLAAWVRAYCYDGSKLGSPNKKVPDIVKIASMRQIRHFLKYFNDRNRDGSQYYSTSKKLIDDLQELHLRLGKRSHIGWRDGKATPFSGNKSGVIRSSGHYVLTVGEVDRLCLDRKKHIATDRYNGNVFCATVPNGTLITRRNGSVLISGNCWSYSSTGCVMMLRAAMGQPYIRLSAHGPACKIKGFRDEGGWGALSYDFIVKNGVPSVAAWPEKSMSRSNDRPETWEDAKKYKITEGWVDLDRAVYDRNLTFEQVATCLLCNIPVVGDFNWWGHSVCLLDLVEVSSGSFGVRILNSWSDAWGDKGMSVLEGSKAIPDGGVAPRVAIAA